MDAAIQSERPAPAGETVAVSVLAVETGAGFAQLREEWRALLQESGASVFNSWEWLYPWYRRIGSARRLCLLTARTADGKLVGLLPLAREERKPFGHLVRRLAFLGESHVGSDYLDVLAVPALRRRVTEEFAHALRNGQDSWDVLDLLDLCEDSPTLGFLHHAFDGYEQQTTTRYVCPYEPLAVGEPFDDFLKRTARRDIFLRRKRWLEKQEGFAIERTERPEKLAAPMAEFFRLHRLRWASEGGSQGIKGPSVEAFHRDATELLAEGGETALYTLRVGRQAVASVYALIHGGKFYYFQSGYDPAWRSRSVGLVLIGETFRDALARGLTEYDFLRGTETYKSEWVSRTRETRALRIHPRGGAGAWLTRDEVWSKTVRDGLKAVLPGELTERIRRFRRRLAAI